MQGSWQSLKVQSLLLSQIFIFSLPSTWKVSFPPLVLFSLLNSSACISGNVSLVLGGVGGPPVHSPSSEFTSPSQKLACCPVIAWLLTPLSLSLSLIRLWIHWGSQLVSFSNSWQSVSGVQYVFPMEWRLNDCYLCKISLSLKVFTKFS